jgi:hypothetical protein
MKKVFSLLFLLNTFFFTVKSTHAQVVEKGDFVFEVYDGSLFEIIWINDPVLKNDADFKRRIGPVGARFEFMVSDIIGIGFDYNYTYKRSNWFENGYNYNFVRTRTIFMPRINIHVFGDGKLDFYFGFGAGYRNVERNYTSNEPGFRAEKYKPLIVIPYSIRFSYGTRYFLTDNFGLSLEVGLGGGEILHYGLVFKI